MTSAMNDQQLKEIAGTITRQLTPRFPVRAAMLQKNMRRYLATLRFLETYLKPEFAGRILDYGCGFPLLLRLLRESGYDAVGFEPYAMQEHHDVAACLGVSESYFTALPTGAQYDVVTLVDVIEHLSILRPTMTDIIERIRPGGQLVISTPNGLRFGQWLAFVRRKTAHPTAINKFLETDNNYVNHQREFTREELALTVRHYGLEVESLICVDTTPSRRDLDEYRKSLGQSVGRTPWRAHMRDWLQQSLPADWQNNFFLLARKPGP